MRMLLAGFVLCLAGPAMAQDVHQYHVTKFQDVPLSMAVLLNSGYAIVNESIGPDGVGNYLLHRENKWVTCSLKGSEQGGRVVVGSRCVALN